MEIGISMCYHGTIDTAIKKGHLSASIKILESYVLDPGPPESSS